MLSRLHLRALVLLVLLALFPLGAHAAGPLIIKGTLQIQWGEPERAGGIEIYELTALDGTTYQLNLNDTQKAQLGRESGAQVTIEADVVQDYQATVHSVVEVSPKISVQSGDLQSRPRRYLNILCASPGTKNFSNTPANYQTLMQKESGYWYQTAGVKFETDTTDWVFASQPISTYLTFDPVSGWWVPRFHELANTCAQAAQNQIADPSVYDGINFMFAENIGCCAWGGGENVIFNGVSRFYKATWMPPWTDIMAGLAHELGHSIGLPHSAGSDGKVYTNRFDVMSDLWTDCYRNRDAVWGCMPQGTLFPQLMKLNAIETDRYARINTDEKGVVTYYIASHYRPASELPSEYVYGVLIDEKQYGGKFGFTAEYRDNSLEYDAKLPVSGVVLHERNEFGRPEPDHLIADGNSMIWAKGRNFSRSFATVCVEDITTYGAKVSIGVNGGDCANPPVAKADGFVLYNMIIVPTHDIFVPTLDPTINVGVYRRENDGEKHIDTILQVVTLHQSSNDASQYIGYWSRCSSPGNYVIKGAVGFVNITQYTTYLSCSQVNIPIVLR